MAGETASLSFRMHEYIQACRRGKYTFAPIEDIEVEKVVSDASDVEVVEFGEVDIDDVTKVHQARKRALQSEERARKKQLDYLESNKESIERAKKMRLSVRDSLNGQPASKKELNRLRKRAKQAMLAASKRAGGPVKYCCGSIRPVTYECPVNGDHGVEVLEVNSW